MLSKFLLFSLESDIKPLQEFRYYQQRRLPIFTILYYSCQFPTRQLLIFSDFVSPRLSFYRFIERIYLTLSNYEKYFDSVFYT